MTDEVQMSTELRNRIRTSQARDMARSLTRDDRSDAGLRAASELAGEHYGVDAKDIYDHIAASRREADANFRRTAHMLALREHHTRVLACHAA